MSTDLPPGSSSAIATYIRTQFQRILRGDADVLPFPRNWNVTLLYECNLVAEVLARAFRNPYTTSWDVNEYVARLSTKCTGRNAIIENSLLSQFPPIHAHTAHVRDPCVIMDLNGNCLFWYLPGILTDNRKRQTMSDLNSLEKLFKIKDRNNSWRNSSTHFRNGEGWIKPGNVTLSPAWFQQGHERSNPLEVSQALTQDHTREWLPKNETLSLLVGGILNAIHPDLYEVGMSAIEKISRQPTLVHKGGLLETILPHWKSPFSVLSIISNRQTPLHRDNGSHHSWYDVLVALGEYKGGVFTIPGVGMSFQYDPGTIVGMCGRVLQHSAECPGNRVCIAYYMRLNVLKSLELEQPGWANYSDIIDSLGP